MRKVNYRWALNYALAEEMRRDPTVLVYGEDVGNFGGNFGVTRGLIEEFGADRVRDTPISESAIAGSAVGAALAGMRPVPEIMFADFMAVCFDEVVNKIGRYRYSHGGGFPLPITVRTTIGCTGAGSGSEHNQSPEAIYMHNPGLKLVFPATPHDAYGLLKESIRDDDPVIFFEHKRLYGMKGEMPDEEFTVPLGAANVMREGKDVTLISYSAMVHTVMEAAGKLAEEGIGAEVIDLRTLVPLDEEAIIKSVKKTRRAVVVHEASRRCGVGAEISAIIMEKVFDYLDAPVQRVAAPDIPIPISALLERAYLPNAEQVVAAVKALM